MSDESQLEFSKAASIFQIKKGGERDTDSEKECRIEAV